MICTCSRTHWIDLWPAPLPWRHHKLVGTPCRYYKMADFSISPVLAFFVLELSFDLIVGGDFNVFISWIFFSIGSDVECFLLEIQIFVLNIHVVKKSANNMLFFFVWKMEIEMKLKYFTIYFALKLLNFKLSHWNNVCKTMYEIWVGWDDMWLVVHFF